MTQCVMRAGHCQCQPDDGMACPHGTPAQVQAALNREIMRLRARVAELEGTLKWLYDEVQEYQNAEPVSVLSRDEEARIVHVINGSTP